MIAGPTCVTKGRGVKIDHTLCDILNEWSFIRLNLWCFVLPELPFLGIFIRVVFTFYYEHKNVPRHSCERKNRCLIIVVIIWKNLLKTSVLHWQV